MIRDKRIKCHNSKDEKLNEATFQLLVWYYYPLDRMTWLTDPLDYSGEWYQFKSNSHSSKTVTCQRSNPILKFKQQNGNPHLICSMIHVLHMCTRPKKTWHMLICHHLYRWSYGRCPFFYVFMLKTSFQSKVYLLGEM